MAAAGPLCAALGLSRPLMLAIAGSGGKTTLMLALAAELSAAGQAVVITTSTKIFPPDPEQAAGPWLLAGAAPDTAGLARRLRPGRPLAVADGLGADGKLAGLAPAQLAALAARPELWVLVEADGAAGRPLKAWAEYEPALPEGAGAMVLLVGASGLGRPLGPETVHRPGLFAAASGLEPGRAVTARALARVLTGPAGPLRAWLRQRPAALIANQADAAEPGELAGLGRALAKGPFRPLLAGSLARGHLEPLGR